MEGQQTGHSPNMADLVPISEIKVGAALVPTANARELHDYLEVRRDFSEWMKARITKYGFVEGVDFVTEVRSPKLGSKEGFSPKLGKTSKGGRPEIDYHLTLDMAKELAMVENNPMGREARRYFIECEKRVLQARDAGPRAATSDDAEWAAWLALSAEERRTRQKDVLIYKLAYGAPGMRICMLKEGMPRLPVWAVGVREQHEMELAVTVTVGQPGAGR